MDTQDAQDASGQHPDRPVPGKLPPPSRHACSFLRRGVTVVEIRGTVDVSTLAEVRTHTDAASEAQGAHLIVDLRPVTFLDCATLGLLCRTRRRAGQRDGRLALVCVRPWHLRILHAAGLGKHFELFDTVQEALDREH
ncbi:STAS domain-containing protein [Streptomyces sp. NPDC058308]|uniref:STAS domain-containing protein n=1 Tax=Streptomyces sp. NPDC058308 TaxID=3346440 RepID=UPI0036EA4C2E